MLRGVQSAISGYANGDVKDPTYKAVRHKGGGGREGAG